MANKALAFLGLHRRGIAIVTALTTLTIVMTWPLMPQMSESVIGWVGDNFYFVWLVGWYQKSLLVLHQLPLSVPFLNYPEGWHIAYNEITPAMILVGLPVSVVGGATLGYNFSILLSFVLSGLGVYLWVYRLSRNVAAGVIAGVIFAFAPYRMSHLVGHLNLMGTQWFPFYFMNLAALLESPHPSRKTILLTATFLGLIALTSQYYLYMSLIISTVFVAGYWLANPKLSHNIGFWKRLGWLSILSLPVLVASVWPYLQLAAKGGLAQRTFEEVRMWSASPLDFLLPSPRHFIWGEWIGQTFDRWLWVENTLYLGIVALVLAGLGLVKPKRVGLRKSRIVAVLACTGFVAFSLALGTDLHWMGESVTVAVPQFIQRWHPYPRTFLPLPGYFLFRFLPLYDGMRVWMRYGVFVSLFVSVLAGIGSARLLERFRPRYATAAGVAILLLVLVDYYPGVQSLSTVSERSVDRWLASQAGQGAVVQFPFWQVTRPEQTYYTSIHNKPFVGGFFAAFAPAQFQRIRPILRSFPDDQGVDLLRELGVRWVIVDSTWYEDYGQVHGVLESLGLRSVGTFDGEYVYELR